MRNSHIIMARILIVDSEPTIVESVSTLCRDRGHQPFHYDSSEAAIHALPEVAPHLVIADLKTEKNDGFDILRKCRENDTHTVVVMTGGFVSDELAQKAMQSGAFDYVTKPVKVDELQLCIQRTLDHQIALRRSDALK